MFILENDNMISREKLLDEFFADTPYGCDTVGIKYVNELIQKQPIAFDIDMVLEQIEDYGKYKGILRVEEDGKSENYIPVSIAKRIVRCRGLGGVLGYLEDEKNEIGENLE